MANLCLASYVSLGKRDVESTAESFKHWGTCMDNHVCKIVAIVGIVVACVCLIFWGILRCCCLCGRSRNYINAQQQPPPPPSYYQPQPYSTSPYNNYNPPSRFNNNDSSYYNPEPEYSYGYVHRDVEMEPFKK